MSDLHPYSPDDLVPQRERIVDFYGDAIPVALVADDMYVSLRAICDFLGLNWSGQYQRTQRDEVLARRITSVIMTTADGRQRPTLCLPLDLLAGWLFGVQSNRVKLELREKLTRYREECFRVLWQAFRDQLVVSEPALSPATELDTTNPESIAALERIITQSQAITRLAQEHLALLHRMDMAARVVRGLQLDVTTIRSDVGDLQVRVGVLEENINPSSVIAEVQAATILVAVQRIATVLTRADPSKNHFQAIYVELHDRFGVTSYRNLTHQQYPLVLAFLREWSNALGIESPPEQSSLF